MFNLFRNQGSAVKFLLGGILVLVALSMVVYLIPSYTDPSAAGANPVLVQVGDRKFNALDLQAMFQRQTQGQVPAELLQVYFPQYIETTIVPRYAAIYQAKSMGITATDEEALDALMRVPMVAPYFQNGKLVNII
jgi:hypothetical protein